MLEMAAEIASMAQTGSEAPRAPTHRSP